MRTAAASLQSTTVDVRPFRGTGASTMTSMSPSSCASTSRALRASGAPERLALVPVSGPSWAAISRIAASSGTRTPIVSPPPAASVRYDARRRSTIVIAPGQNDAASARAASFISATSSACSTDATNSGSGCSAGRAFTSYRRRTAASSAATAQRPYTVSVGSATRPPAASASIAFRY